MGAIVYQKKRINVVNMLLCVIIAVCSLYCEPLQTYNPAQISADSVMLHSTYSLENVEAEPETIADRNEQIVTDSLKRPGSKHSNRKGITGITGRTGLPLTGLPTFHYSKRVGAWSVSGADAFLFKIISYIWSQIGL